MRPYLLLNVYLHSVLHKKNILLPLTVFFLLSLYRLTYKKNTQNVIDRGSAAFSTKQSLTRQTLA